MKRIIQISVSLALLIAIGYVGITLYQKSVRAHENALKQAKELREYSAHLENTLDKLREEAMLKDVEIEDLEEKADSLAREGKKPMPCEHELEIRKQEVKVVREALAKCKEAKAIQSTRVSLAEIKVENEVELCGQLRAIEKRDFKKEKRKSFFKGMATGGGAILLLILAL